MKRIVLIFSLLLIGLPLVGCKTISTEYDDKEILRIETSVRGSWESVYYTRVFDFETGTVADEFEVDEDYIENRREWYAENPMRFPEYESAEAYEEYLTSHYNTPMQISTFDGEKAEEFMKKMISYGFYTWESYNYPMMDGTGYYLDVYFTDGTVKTAKFYGVKPDWLTSSEGNSFFLYNSGARKEYMNKVQNYKKCNSAFKKYLGAEIFMLTDRERQ